MQDPKRPAFGRAFLFGWIGSEMSVRKPQGIVVFAVGIVFGNDLE